MRQKQTQYLVSDQFPDVKTDVDHCRDITNQWKHTNNLFMKLS